MSRRKRKVKVVVKAPKSLSTYQIPITKNPPPILGVRPKEEVVDHVGNGDCK